MGGEGRAPKGNRHGGGFLQIFDWNAKSRKKLFPSKSEFPEHPKQGKTSKGNSQTTRTHPVSSSSCASSVAPGVVARLMGLDSLPASNLTDPFFDNQSLGNAVEKFQSEILPRRSARSIPITQHRLLSPVKNPRFVPSNDLAGIMEAAAKIIDAGPQSSRRARVYSAGPLKGKMAARRFEGEFSEKRKSISLAVQAKANVQRRRQQEGEASKNEPSSQKTAIARKKPSVLRQNNQKQNCNPGESLGARRKAVTGDSSHGRQGSLPRKKRIVDGNRQGEKISTSNSKTDVVSFTFATPMSRSMDLSDLLEQKLRELTKRDSTSATEVPRRRYDLQREEMNPSPVAIHGSSELNESSDFEQRLHVLTEWEMDYIKDVLSNIELMYKDYASGRTRDTINPHLFDQLERKRGSSSSYKAVSLGEKKALFDCVSECLGWRCQRLLGGGFRAWERGLAMVRRKERLVEEVYGEIQGWRRMRSWMVDEVVAKDMSLPHGRWLDFEGDGFGVAVEVEAMVFDDLVVEVVDDVLADCCWIKKD